MGNLFLSSKNGAYIDYMEKTPQELLRNCGATTGSNLQISVLPISKALSSGADNAFIADDNHGATRFVARPEWMSARRLRIVYSSKARVFKKEAKVGLIDIEYAQEP